MKSTKIIIGLSALIALNSNAINANGFFDLEEGINIIGLGVGSIPDYQGSDDSDVTAGPYGRYYFSNFKYAELLGSELVVNFSDSPALHYGPLVRYRFGRDTDVDDSVVRKMREIDDTVEVGAFIKRSIALDNDPRHRFNIVGDISFDAGGEHDGFLASARVSYFKPITPGLIGHVGGGTTYASDNYMDTYYGVDSVDAGLTGLPTLKAGSGMHDYRVYFGLIQHLSPQWQLGAGARYQRLLGDASDSPVVDLRGDKNQWTYGVGLGYVWQ
jgi:outer membrane protein